MTLELLSAPLSLILFGGKGGVGKTTSALAAALARARQAPESPCLLVSTDPAHSLRHALRDHRLPSNLTLLELDTQASLERFRSAHSKHLEEIARRGTFLDQADIQELTRLSLPGMDEVVAVLELMEWVEARTYHVIVVDTAPTGHTWRLLTVPRLLRRWLQALDTLLAKHRYMKKLFSGHYEPDDVDGFLLTLNAQLKRLEKLLRDPARTRFVPVSLAEPLPLAETARLLDLLKSLRMPVREGLINRLVPENGCAVCASQRVRQQALLAESPLLPAMTWIGLPLLPEEPLGQHLERFFSGSERLNVGKRSEGEPLTSPETPSSPDVGSGDVQVERVFYPPPLPGPSLKVLLLAGKGGVGKTTLACATALRLAEAYPNRRILLFSTDPAHSLSDCLGQPIGARPVRLKANLEALEVDAEAELRELKRLYSNELERLLRSTLRNLDLTFDEEVMKQLLDLSPPGIDEVMALTVAMEQLDTRIDLLILDSAPTGHLLRLLEMPEMLQQWLRTFFALMLKYKEILKLPKVTDRLITMSKSLRQLRALLQDPARAQVLGVTIPTQVAIDETLRLKEGCERVGAPLPTLFFNLVTPHQDCPLCRALVRREDGVLDAARVLLPSLWQAQVLRQEGLERLDGLEALGRALFLDTLEPRTAGEGSPP